MLVRIILLLGVALILLSGGAMAWQYWQGLPGGAERDAVAEPAAPEATTPVPAPTQSWLISPGGGLVDRDTARAFLIQTQLQPGRGVTVAFRAPMAALLAEGEQLPAEPYLNVFGDVRARALAAGFCEALTARWASDCALDRATMAGDSFDPASGTAAFALALAYSQTVAAPLPDLGQHALFTAFGALDPAAGPQADTPQALLGLAAEAAAQDCALRAPDPAHCRISRMSLEWDGAGRAAANWQIAWLAPLPQGMYPVPPLY